MIRFPAILPVINWRRFNWTVLTNLVTFVFGGILTCGRFGVDPTYRLKAEPEVHRCGEVDFDKRRREYPNSLHWGTLILAQRRRSLHFQKQVGIH